MNGFVPVLAQTPLFSGLDQAALAEFAALAAWKNAPKGQVIFHEGEIAETLYIVGEGKVKIFRAAPDGRETLLHIFGPGEPFGEAAVLQGGKFPASSLALESSLLVALPRRDILAAFAKNPVLALNMMGALAARLRAFSAKIESLTLLETPQRLAAYLIHESGARDEADSFRLDVSKGLLAAMLGTARETLSRCLARMAEQGAIRLEGRDVHILDRAYLESLAKGLEKL